MSSCPSGKSLVKRLDDAHVAIVAAHAALLAAISEVEEAQEWRGDGAANMATWMSARYQESYATTRKWVESSRALSERPALDAAFAAGQVSGDQMHALVTLTRPGADDDAVWLEQLADWSIDDLQREARKQRARQLERKDGGRYVSLRWTPDERFLKIDGRLHPDEGAALMKAIDRSVPNDAPWESIDKHRADGLVALARVKVSEDADADRATVVVHLDDETLRGGVAGLEAGGFVGSATAMRLSCDPRLETVAYDGSRRPVGIGRASRLVPAPMYRELRYRDRSCVFPCCGRTRFVQAHHVIHWSQGGRTDLDNLVLLCTHHHELVHEGGWSLRGEAGPRIGWVRPDGTAFEPTAAYDTS
jgi:hypothetical protein